MSKVQDTSCSDIAMALGLSPFATLALRASLMILKHSISVPKDRCLKVSIGSSNLSIRVSRVRRYGLSRSRKTKCLDAPASGFTETTPRATAQPRPGALSATGTIEDSSSAAYLGAIY